MQVGLTVAGGARGAHRRAAVYRQSGCGRSGRFGHAEFLSSSVCLPCVCRVSAVSVRLLRGPRSLPLAQADDLGMQPLETEGTEWLGVEGCRRARRASTWSVSRMAVPVGRGRGPARRRSGDRERRSRWAEDLAPEGEIGHHLVHRAVTERETTRHPSGRSDSWDIRLRRTQDIGVEVTTEEVLRRVRQALGENGPRATEGIDEPVAGCRIGEPHQGVGHRGRSAAGAKWRSWPRKRKAAGVRRGRTAPRRRTGRGGAPRRASWDRRGATAGGGRGRPGRRLASSKRLCVPPGAAGVDVKRRAAGAAPPGGEAGHVGERVERGATSSVATAARTSARSARCGPTWKRPKRR